MKAVIYFMLHFLRMKEESITERGCLLKELINIYRQQENDNLCTHLSETGCKHKQDRLYITLVLFRGSSPCFLHIKVIQFARLLHILHNSTVTL